MKKFDNKKSFLFIASGRPSPSYIDVCHNLSSNNRNIICIYIDRGNEDLLLNAKKINFSLIKLKRNISNPLVRILTIIEIFLIFKKKFSKNILVIESFDMLIFFSLFSTSDKIVYWCRDLHYWQYPSLFNSLVLTHINKIIFKKTILLLATSQSFIDYLTKQGFKNKSSLLENFPDKDLFENLINSNIKYNTQEKKSLIIGYVGIVRYLNQLENFVALIDALTKKYNKNIVLYIYGGGRPKDLNRLHVLLEKYNWIKYQGPFEYTKNILNIYSKIDFSLALYDSDDFNCKYAMPNKYYESIFTGTPIIVSKGTFLADQVEKNNLGFSIKLNNNFEENIDYLFESLNKSFNTDYNSRNNLLLSGIKEYKYSIENLLAI